MINKEVYKYIMAMREKNIYFSLESGRLVTSTKYSDIEMEKKDIDYIRKNKQDIIKTLWFIEKRDGTSIPELNESDYDKDLPVSFQQRRLLITDSISENGSEYNSIEFIRLRGNLNIKRFVSAIRSIIADTEIFRTVYCRNGDDYTQRVRNSNSLDEYINLHYVKEERQVKLFLDEEINHRFNLFIEIPLRVKILCVSENVCYVIFNFHHICWDAQTSNIFFSRLTAIYNGDDFKSEINSYREYSNWQRNLLKDDILDSILNFWNNKLTRDSYSSNLPFDYKDRKSKTSDTVEHFFTNKLNNVVKKLSKKNNVTPYIIYETALVLLIHIFSDATFVTTGSPYFNRETLNFQNTIGFFVNMLIIDQEVSGEDTVREFIRKVNQTVNESITYQEAPFDKIVELLDIDKGTKSNPIFETVLAYQNTEFPQLLLDGIESEFLDVPQNFGRFNLEIHIFDDNSSSEIKSLWVFSKEYYKKESIDKFIAYFEKLIFWFDDNLDTKIKDLSFDEDVKEEILSQYQIFECAHFDLRDELLNNLDSNPILLKHGQNNYTISDIFHGANNIFKNLKQKQIDFKNEILVAMDNSYELLCLIICLWYSEIPYTVIDNKTPNNRITEMLQITGSSTIICDNSFADVIQKFEDFNVTILVLDALFETVGSKITDNNLELVDHYKYFRTTDSKVYTIFTSGTSGIPKAVEINLQNLNSYLYGIMSRVVLEKNLKFLWHSTLVTDFGYTTLLLSLSTGGCLILPDEKYDLLNSSKFLNLIKTEQIDFLKITPSYFQALYMGNQVTECSYLPRVVLMFGGEELSSKILSYLNSIENRGFCIFNHYGPTETTIGVIAGEISDFSKNNKVPIGIPLNGVGTLLLNQYGYSVPPGALGYLHIFGPQVGKYTSHSESFYQKDLGDDKIITIYNTGDLVRQNDNGEFIFYGRNDNQTKIRGYRVELEEINKVIEHEDEVIDCKTILYQNNFYSFIKIAKQISDLDSYVNEWNKVYDYSYKNNKEASLFNISGWKSSYTHEVLPKQQMLNWRNAIIQKILNNKNVDSILEIGCGFGLFAFELINYVNKYVGTDFSSEIIDHNQKLLQSKNIGGNISFLPLEAQKIPQYINSRNDNYDIVLINSVVQYFPTIDYLTTLIKNIYLTNKVSSIFIGDIRDYDRLESFILSKIVYNNKSYENIENIEQLKELKNRIKKDSKNLTELTISPKYFYSLLNQYKFIEEIRLFPRISEDKNELTEYRYDVRINFKKDIENQFRSYRKIRGITYIYDNRDKFENIESELNNEEIDYVILKKVPFQKRVQQSNAIIREDLKSFNLCNNTFIYEVDSLNKLINSSTLNFYPFFDFSQSGYINIVISNLDLTNEELIDLQKIFYDELRIVNHKEFSNNVMVKESVIESLYLRLENSLPKHMLPSKIYEVDEFPLNRTGKLDVKALIRLIKSDEEVGTELDSDISKKIGIFFKEILNSANTYTLESNFFENGGNSLLSIRLIQKIEEYFDISLNIGEIFDNPKISELEVLILDKITKINLNSERQLYSKFETYSETVCTYGQERLWLLEFFFDEGSPYNINNLYNVSKLFDRNKLRAKLKKIIQYNLSLREYFLYKNGTLFQCVKPMSVAEKDGIVDKYFSNKSDFFTWLNKKKVEKIDLEKWSSKFYICQVDKKLYLYCKLHHVIFDGISEKLFITQLVSNQPEVFDGISQIGEYAFVEKKLKKKDDKSQGIKFWKDYLKNLTPLLSDASQMVGKSGQNILKNDMYQITIDHSLIEKFNKVCSREKITLFMGLQLIFSIVLSEEFNRSEIYLTTPIDMRKNKFHKSIGFYVNTIILKNKIISSDFSTLAQINREGWIRALEESHIDFATIINNFKRKNPLDSVIESMFILQNIELQSQSELEIIDLNDSYNKFGLTVNSAILENGYVMKWEFNTNIFSLDVISQLASTFKIKLEKYSEMNLLERRRDI
ncbi:condensation domain-containing protein [Streptococcus salivarius]